MSYVSPSAASNSSNSYDSGVNMTQRYRSAVNIQQARPESVANLTNKTFPKKCGSKTCAIDTALLTFEPQSSRKGRKYAKRQISRPSARIILSFTKSPAMDFQQLIGKKVIVRTYSAGCFFGEVEQVAVDGSACSLRNSRRLWYWKGAASLSQLAVTGTSKPNECKFPAAIPQQFLANKIEEFIVCEPAAITSIENVPTWQE